MYKFIKLNEMEERFPIEEMKYGLIVVDKREEEDENGNVTILHFVGYQNKPDCANISELRRELSSDASFGLADIMEYCGIYEAPESLVEQYRNMMLSGEIEEMTNEDETTEDTPL